MGRSRSLKIAPFDRSYDFLLVGHCKYSSELYHSGVIWHWIIVTLEKVTEGHSKFKLVPFDVESLDRVSYSPSILTMAVSLAISEIFSVTEWSYLEVWVWGRSRSLKMAWFDRSCVTFYWSAIVTIALCCTVFQLFNVE